MASTATPPKGISYALAKELKDAGFPQGDVLACPCMDIPAAERGNFQESYDCNREGVYKPTLEELIEVCGTICLVIRNDTPSVPWSAEGDKWDGNKSVRNGETPTEAVARLWLVLNKK